MDSAFAQAEDVPKKNQRCQDCDNPLPPGAEYCGRCGAGVRTVPVGCALVVLVAVIMAFVLVMRAALKAMN